MNEKDSTILKDEIKEIILYPNILPDKSINGKLTSVTPIPVLTESNSYCYKVKLNILNNAELATAGMRGIAVFKGNKTSIGYFFFKNLIYWWRTL